MSNKPKTLTECKDEMAMKYEFADFVSAVDCCESNNAGHELVAIIDQANAIYYGQFKESKQEKNYDLDLIAKQVGENMLPNNVTDLEHLHFQIGFKAAASCKCIQTGRPCGMPCFDGCPVYSSLSNFKESNQPSIARFTDDEIYVISRGYGDDAVAYHAMSLIQEKLQKRVNAVDPVKFLEWIIEGYWIYHDIKKRGRVNQTESQKRPNNFYKSLKPKQMSEEKKKQVEELANRLKATGGNLSTVLQYYQDEVSSLRQSNEELLAGLKRAENDFRNGTWTEETYNVIEKLIQTHENKK